MHFYLSNFLPIQLIYFIPVPTIALVLDEITLNFTIMF